MSGTSAAVPAQLLRFGRRAPALSGGRAAAVTAVRITVSLLAVCYVLWLNYVIFRGGRIPLTSW